VAVADRPGRRAGAWTAGGAGLLTAGGEIGDGVGVADSVVNCATGEGLGEAELVGDGEFTRLAVCGATGVRIAADVSARTTTASAARPASAARLLSTYPR